MQYVVSLLVIITIAVVDNFLIVEPITTPVPANMVWIDGSAFNANANPGFTERDTTQDFQSAGFWIDSDTVSETEYALFVDTSGYAGTGPVQPSWLLAEPSSKSAHAETIYALRGTSITSGDDRDRHYVSSTDALAYCNWKGLEKSSRQQELAATRHKHIDGTANDITLHASQPLSDLSGFRCVKLLNQVP